MTDRFRLSRAHAEVPHLRWEPGQAPATFWVSEFDGGVFLKHLLRVRHWTLQGANQTLTHGAYILERTLSRTLGGRHCSSPWRPPTAGTVTDLREVLWRPVHSGEAWGSSLNRTR